MAKRRGRGGEKKTPVEDEGERAHGVRDRCGEGPAGACERSIRRERARKTARWNRANDRKGGERRKTDGDGRCKGRNERQETPARNSGHSTVSEAAVSSAKIAHDG